MPEMVMKTAAKELVGREEIVKRKEAEPVRAFRKRDGIAIGKRVDQMDGRELQIKGRIHDRRDI
jgi:hypothetical protein